MALHLDDVDLDPVVLLILCRPGSGVYQQLIKEPLDLLIRRGQVSIRLDHLIPEPD